MGQIVSLKWRACFNDTIGSSCCFCPAFAVASVTSTRKTADVLLTELLAEMIISPLRTGSNLLCKSIPYRLHYYESGCMADNARRAYASHRTAR